MLLLMVFLLGVVSGFRTFTGPAVLWIMRHDGFLAYVLGAAALYEYYYDVSPKTGSRTGAFGMTCRVLSGAFVGWFGAADAGVLPILGLLVGITGAIVGAYGSLILRRQCMTMIGNIASGILEDLVVIAASVALVFHL